MPELLEPPPAHVKTPFRFTRENAREFALKGNAIRWSQLAIDERVAMLNEQITLTRASLNGDDLEPKDRAQLIRGLCGLLDQLRIAKGEPLPGSRRPAREDTRRPRGLVAAPEVVQSMPAPAQPAPQPAPAPARPMGWEYDEPTPAVLELDKLPGDVTP